MPDPDAIPMSDDALPDLAFLRLDAGAVVVGFVRTNVQPAPDPALAPVTAEVFAAARAALGCCTWDGAALAPHVPPSSPAPPRQQLGGTFLGTVADLGWWGWMEQGAAAQAAAGKPLDQRYWTSIGKADLVLETDAKLNRVAKAAEAARVASSGQPAPTAPFITMAAIMDHDSVIAKA